MVRQFRLSLLIFFITWINSGCAGSRLSVTSTPENADIQIVTRDRTFSKVGKTPADLDEKNAPDLFTESLQLQISKEGFQPQSVLIPRLPTGGFGKVHINLGETVLPKVCQAQEESLNEVARGVAEASNLIQKKRYSEANLLLQNLTTKFNSVAVLHDLQGNAFYLQKDLIKALEAYKRSNALAPENPNTLRMIQRIQQLQGQPGGF